MTSQLPIEPVKIDYKQSSSSGTDAGRIKTGIGMELGRPQVPEKPPVAAKPKLRLAPPPPLPPKPTITTSPNSSKKPQSNASECGQNHDSQLQTTVNGGPNNASPTPPESKNGTCRRAGSAEVLSTTPNSSPRSPEPPPLPSSPPPLNRKSPLSPSSSSSLPASFRNKKISTMGFSTPLTLNTSTSPISPSSPMPPTSPIRHVSPPKRTPPLTKPKPKLAKSPKPGESIERSPVSDSATQEIAGKSALGDDAPASLVSDTACARDTISADEQIQITTTTNKSSQSQSPASKAQVSPPQRPTFPPQKQTSSGQRPSAPEEESTPLSSESTSTKPITPQRPKVSPQKPQSPPSRPAPTRPAPPAVKQPVQKKNASKHVQATTDTEPKSQSDKRPGVPPPLPKNPPRGGVPRKPRSSNTKTTPTSEIKPPFQKDKPSHDTSHNKKTGTEDISVITKSQSVVDSSNKKNKSHNSVSGKSRSPAQAPRETVDLRESGHLEENGDVNLSETPGTVSKRKTPPKPRPRTRLSLSSPDTDQPSQDQNSKTTVAELDYVEPYRGDPEDGESSEAKFEGKTSRLSSSTQIVNNTQNQGAISQDLSDTTVKKGSKQPFQKQEHSAESKEAPNSDNLNILFETKKLLTQEPEATCGMLKEIEELLNSKLGNLDLETTENITAETEVETREGRSDSLFSVSSRDSPSSSPVRPPRPRRQASISKSIGSGSVESLNSLDGSSTERLSQVGLASASGRKIGPPKPKRANPPRVNRSHSDVTGMKSIVDGAEENLPSSNHQQHTEQEEGKPYLPPRLESLRRSESSTSCQTPPPLPPRNKPRSSSSVDLGRAESELCQDDPPTESTSIEDNMSGAPGKPLYKMGDRSESGPGKVSSSQSPDVTKPQSSPQKTKSGLSPTHKTRPTRKAPPPPPSPKRSATFSPGDKHESESGQSSKSSDSKDSAKVPPPSPRAKGSNDVPVDDEEEDHAYHEIKDTGIRFRRETSSQEKEASPPPTLPPRSFRSSCQDGNGSDSSDSNKDVNVSKSSETPQKDNGSRARRSSCPEDQKLREKLAKSALVQKVQKGLGLSKSFKKPRVLEISHPVVDSNTSAKLAKATRERSKTEGEKSTEADNLSTGSNSASESMHGHKDDEGSNTAAGEGTSSSNTSSERPLSHVSQQSTGSEQEGEGQVFSSQALEGIDSSESETEPEEGKEEIYAQRKAKKVFMIAKEITTSENTFVDVLKLMNLDFRIHISQATEKQGNPVIPSETLNKILHYLPQLQNFNEELLKDLTERVNSWDKNPRLADIFVKKGPFLKLYSSYISNFEEATSALEDACKKNVAFAAALKEFEMSPRCAKLALKHYMLKPIQRIPQYKLLLQDYLKHLSEDSPDYKDTVTALNIVSEVADHANAKMREGDNVQKLLDVQKSLLGQFEVLQPGRELIKQGELQKVSRKEMQPRTFILFSDVLLYTTATAMGYKVNNILPLVGMKVSIPKLEDYKFEFSIISVQRSFTLCASTSEEKEEWISALQNAIDENTKKHHTFEAVKHGPQTSLLDKDFVLGSKAPLWVPDARVTMCMVCLVEFTLTWRRHHCRACGRIICSQCSENKAPLKYLKYKTARVCDKCFDNLKAKVEAEVMHEHHQKKRSKSVVSTSEEESSTSISEGATEDSTEGGVPVEEVDEIHIESGLSISSLLARFQKIRISNREKAKPNHFRPSVLKEVHANDEGSDMSGYLRAYKSRKWKRFWFVVKGKVLYTYKASEDMAASESMPLLGYEVTCFNKMFENVEPELLFELTHQNIQPLTSKSRGILGGEKTTQRLIFRTDSAAATTKWVTVLKEAALSYQ